MLPRTQRWKPSAYCTLAMMRTGIKRRWRAVQWRRLGVGCLWNPMVAKAERVGWNTKARWVGPGATLHRINRTPHMPPFSIHKASKSKPQLPQQSPAKALVSDIAPGPRHSSRPSHGRSPRAPLTCLVTYTHKQRSIATLYLPCKMPFLVGSMRLHPSFQRRQHRNISGPYAELSRGGGVKIRIMQHELPLSEKCQ
jgi:hypothetical protein